MSETVPFTFGAIVSCRDGACGELRRAVVDSTTYTISHLVVEAPHGKHKGRMVPIDLVETTTGGVVRLRCTLADYESLDEAEQKDLRTEMTLDVESQRAEVQTMSRLVGLHFDFGMGLRPARRAVTEDNIPEGEGEILQGQHVHASDGPVGHLKGIRADRLDHKVTCLLLDEGHLWGEKEVAIPIGAVKYVFDDGVHLRLTKKEVGDLAPLAG